MSQVHIDAVNAAGIMLVNNVRNLKLPLIESDNTEQLLEQLNAIIASVSAVVSAIKAWKTQSRCSYDPRSFIRPTSFRPRPEWCRG
jgi:hypothetical protein